jgi:hypothetical protein
VSWLIAGLLGLVFVGGLLLFIRGRGRSRPSADDTLVTDLLGPPDLPAVPAPQARRDGAPSPARQAPDEAQRSPARQAPDEAQRSPAWQAPDEGQPSPALQAPEEDERSPVPPAPPAAEENWLETQLAWINAWSRRMDQQIASAEQPKPRSKE